MIIYKVTDLTNNKCYIGKTIQNFSKRKERHIYDVINKNDNTYFHNALRDHGVDNFKWEIICECNSKEELDEKEKYYIKENKSYWKENGYNLTFGGDGGDTYTNNPNKENIRKKYVGRYVGIDNPRFGKGDLILGVNNPNSKKYKVTYSNGNVEIINCLKTWCYENNFSYNSVKCYIHRNKKYGYNKLYKGILIKKLEVF